MGCFKATCDLLAYGARFKQARAGIDAVKSDLFVTKMAYKQ
jgi:hypothetical protein